MKNPFTRYTMLLFLFTGNLFFYRAEATPGIALTMKTAVNVADTTGNPWIFRARQAQPQGSRSRILTSEYAVKYSPGKIVVALPYFGRAYAGAGYGIQNALDFTSTDFSYTETSGRKNRRIISIKPNDYSEVQSLEFTYYPNGSARLSIILTNRSPISFTGDLSYLPQ